MGDGLIVMDTNVYYVFTVIGLTASAIHFAHYFSGVRIPKWLSALLAGITFASLAAITSLGGKQDLALEQSFCGSGALGFKDNEEVPYDINFNLFVREDVDCAVAANRDAVMYAVGKSIERLHAIGIGKGSVELVHNQGEWKSRADIVTKYSLKPRRVTSNEAGTWYWD